jgi:poly(A) polymerase
MNHSSKPTRFTINHADSESPQYQRAGKIINTINDAGYNAYIVGGWVRNQLMNKPCHDIDITCNAPIDILETLFPNHIAVGKQFGCLVVLINGQPFEITTFRQDGHYVDGRHPTSISPGTMIDDAARRDFTINALYFDTITNEVIDHVGGFNDIKHNRLQTVGDPNQRFTEDKLRIIRAFRFAAVYGLKIDKSTRDAAIKLAPEIRKSVSVERIWAEFEKVFHAHQLLRFIHLIQSIHCERYIFHFGINSIEVRDHAELSFYRLPPIVAMALISSKADGVAPFYKRSKNEVKQQTVFQKIKHLWTTDPMMRNTYDWCYCLSESFSVDLLRVLHHLNNNNISWHEIDDTIVKWSNRIDAIKTNRFPVSAQDLMECGYKPGPEMGIMLTHAKRFAIEENIWDKTIIISKIKHVKKPT